MLGATRVKGVTSLMVLTHHHGSPQTLWHPPRHCPARWPVPGMDPSPPVSST